MTAMEQMGQKARQAARELNAVSGTQKNAALEAMASSLEEQTGAVLEANERDITRARAAGMIDSMIDRAAPDERAGSRHGGGDPQHPRPHRSPWAR